MAGIQLTLSRDGKKAVAVYNDNLKALRPVLGKPVVTRASHVRYDPERELWVAYRAGTDEILCEHESRDECIKKEVEVLNSTIHKEI
jgi:hypothetical protein